MSLLEDFIKKYDGKFVEAGGSANAMWQCTDLANQWLSEGLGLPKILGTNAIDFPKKANDKLVWIKNTPDGIPSEGDLVIYDLGPYGHIDIFTKSLSNTSFNAFSQNWPVGSVCTTIKHYYIRDKVVGWLHPIISSEEDMLSEEQKRILDFIGNKTEGDVREAFGALADLPQKDKQIQTLQSRVLDLENSQKSLEDRIVALESDIKANQDLVADWQKKYTTANKQVEKTLEQLGAMTSEKNKYKGWYEKALEKSADKLTSWELFKLFIQKLKNK